MLGPKPHFTTETQRHRERSFSDFLCVSVSLWLITVVLPRAGFAQTFSFRDIPAQAGIHFTHNNGAFG